MPSSFLDELLQGSPDHRATVDLGGAIFAPVDGTDAALERFQRVGAGIIANDGLGYRVKRVHRSSDRAASEIDFIVINTLR